MMFKRFSAIALGLLGATLILLAFSIQQGECWDAAANLGKFSSCTSSYPFWYFGLFGVVAIVVAVWAWLKPKK